ncbi:MAG TPA: S8/S53 family peptidase, partial [Streptosporangiaceae bacterium]
LSAESVRRITLEHLLAGAALGSPASDGAGISGSPASQGHGITGPGSTDSYLFGGFDSRMPVAVCMEAPPRESEAECKTRFGRRPVIMTLDTGALAHPWLDVRAYPGRVGDYQTQPDGFVNVDWDMQDVIRQESEQAGNAGDRPRQVIRTPWDKPFTSEPLVGELATDVGHGVFIAGIVRQVVPNARVLSVRVMFSDGIVYEGVLIRALRLLATRVAAAMAKGGDMAKMVDVLSLSLGYFSETPADEFYTSGLWDVIDTLLGMGVAVTASAGNYATSRRCYPAAFADRTPTQDLAAPLISVGALNPNGSKAVFSDGGPWVRAWATGAAIVSTFPAELNGSRQPQIRRPAHPANPVLPGLAVSGEREAFDSDDFGGAFAIWSGTSFSAPLVAATLARLLLQGAADPGLRLDEGGTDAAVRRIRQALTDLGWQG